MINEKLKQAEIYRRHLPEVALCNAESLYKEMLISLSCSFELVDRINKEAPSEVLTSHHAQDHAQSVTRNSINLGISEKTENLVQEHTFHSNGDEVRVTN